MSYIQALRFVYILKINKCPDPEVHLLDSLLQNGDTAIDVGANSADWTYYLHQCTGDNGNIFAFEADPYYASATELTIKFLRLKGIHFFPFGLSNKNEEAMLRIADVHGQRSSGLGYVDKGARRNDRNAAIVQLKMLDSLLLDHRILSETKLIKCDVEGYELFVFQGATKILDAARPVIILEVGNYDKHGYTAQDVHKFFVEKRYMCFVMTQNGILVETDYSMNHGRGVSVNRVLIPKEKVEVIRKSLQIELKSA